MDKKYKDLLEVIKKLIEVNEELTKELSLLVNKILELESRLYELEWYNYVKNSDAILLTYHYQFQFPN